MLAVMVLAASVALSQEIPASEPRTPPETEATVPEFPVLEKTNLVISESLSNSSMDPYDNRLSGAVIRKRGQVTTYTGLGTMAVAIPTGMGVMAWMSKDCYQECMAAPLVGAFTGSALLITGAVVTLAGVTTSAVGRGREHRQVRLGLGNVSGTF
ncbi:MAG: hypothetical protein GWP91_19690 [Rhodobacterales bacterium]|nr:hypothetical protein [Rhodobacterales bacterium]